MNFNAELPHFINFFIACGKQDNAVEVLGNYVHQAYTFITIVGFFHADAFRVATSDPDAMVQSFSSLAELPKNLSSNLKVRVLESCETWFKLSAEKRETYLKTGMGKRYLKNRLKRFLSLTG